jgi:hypothetical protein
VNFYLTQLLAGIWPLVAGYSSFALAIAACLAFAWFSPVFKKTALWIAAGIAIGLVCYHIGAVHGSDRVQAQWDAAVASTLEANRRAHDDAERDIANGVRDPRDRPDN